MEYENIVKFFIIALHDALWRHKFMDNITGYAGDVIIYMQMGTVTSQFWHMNWKVAVCLKSTKKTIEMWQKKTKKYLKPMKKIFTEMYFQRNC